MPDARYTHTIETSTNGETWQAVRLADAPEGYYGTPAEYGRDVLTQWIADERPVWALINEDGNPLLRVVVHDAEVTVPQNDNAAAVVYPGLDD